MWQMLANRISTAIQADSTLWKFSGDATTVLLILDRREDPVTPLLTQWTYQAMIHDLLGIDRNTVSLKGVAGVPSDLQYVCCWCIAP